MTEDRSSWLYGWKLIVLIYASLLLVSHLWRYANPSESPPGKQQKVTYVNTVKGDSIIPESPVRIAYIDSYTGSLNNPPVVVLLHGSPIGVPMFGKLISNLSGDFRVIAPDFPGYDGSASQVPDYSMKAYAEYMNQFMNRLNVDKAHMVGYSLGGGVALNLAHSYPERVQSVTMLSAIGVQELELLGSHNLNRAVHGVQLSLLWLIYEAVPHFGLLDGFPINIAYARSFYDSDQRPLRAYLKDYKKPMLIQHGVEDGLVPLAAAREHYRIVPQSKLMIYEGGHGMVISKSDGVADDLIKFINTVEEGDALVYSAAADQRIQASNQPFSSVNFVKFEGLTLVIIMLLIALATLISEDLTCIGSGLMAARGLVGFVPAVTACFIGIVLGDMALYLAGRWLGRPAVKKAPLKWFINENDLEQSSKWFASKGPAIILASRFLPGSRLPTYFSAGIIGAGFWMFSFYFLLAAIVWTPVLVGLSMFIGVELIDYFSIYKDYALWIFLGSVLFLFFLAKVIIPVFSYRGRRMLVSRYKRMIKWEFWPPYLLYLPVCIYVLYLWIRHRSLTIFTAANPGIPDGGFIGESKKEILDLFRSTDCVAAYKLIKGADSLQKKTNEAKVFIGSHNLEYPIVLKPDKGQRGEGVVIIKSEKHLLDILKVVEYDLIIQKYIKGQEYGIFYYRFPAEEIGHILSITTKTMPVLLGDGNKTLEELILDDDRAVCLAKMHFEYHRNSLYRVPKAGEEVRLVEFGTHARGAIFEDGEELITSKLTNAINQISNEAEGFYFGRYDIRTSSEADLKEGKNLSIIEVNGVTSETTNIYDKSNSFLDAQRMLANQWRIAFEVGTQNVKRGASYSSIRALVKSLLNYEHK